MSVYTQVNKRVIKDITNGQVNLKKDHQILISPEPENMFNVHFILPGPEDTPYEGGLYHGMIRLNLQHPVKAPNIHMFTPTGRFVAEGYPLSSGSRGICTTATSFHPETWTPINNLETVMIGFLSLMCDPDDRHVGGVHTTNEQKKAYAKASHQTLMASSVVKDLFTDLHESLVNGTYQPVKLSEISKRRSSEKCASKKHCKTTKKPIKEESTDEETDESSEEIKKPVKKTAKKPTKKTTKKTVKKPVKEELSEEESDDDTNEELEESSEEEIKKPRKKPVKKPVKKSVKKSVKKPVKKSVKKSCKKHIKEESSEEESSDDESEESEELVVKKPVKKRKKRN